MKRIRIWFDPPAFSWSRVLRIAGLWGAVVLVVALPIRRTAPEATLASPRGTAPMAVAAATAIAHRMPASAPGEPAQPASAPASSQTDVTTCGGLRVRLAADGRPDLSRLSGTEVDRARQSVLAGLRHSGEPWLAAAALFIEALHDRSVSCREPGCTDSDTLQARLGAIQALARMAETSSDPRIHAIAVSACRGAVSTDPACAPLSAERWALLDPTNAVPWMFVARNAQTRADTAGLDHAMERIAQATHSDTGSGLLPGALAAHVPSDAELPAVMKLVREVIDAQSGALLPPYHPIEAYCSEEALREPERQERCEDIALLLATRSTTVADREAGLHLATRLGWPAEQLEALQGDIEAVKTASASQMPDGAEMLSCEGARRTLAHLAEVGRSGEVAAGLGAFSRCCAAPPPPR
jgi:hypothetical protein